MQLVLGGPLLSNTQESWWGEAGGISKGHYSGVRAVGAEVSFPLHPSQTQQKS